MGHGAMRGDCMHGIGPTLRFASAVPPTPSCRGFGPWTTYLLHNEAHRTDPALQLARYLFLPSSGPMVSAKCLRSLRSSTKSLSGLPVAYAGAQAASRRYAGSLANFKVPRICNEPNVREERPMCQTKDFQADLHHHSIITLKALSRDRGSKRQ